MRTLALWVFSTGKLHPYYPEFLVKPPRLRWINGLWSLLFWALLPMMLTLAGLYIAGFILEKGPLLDNLLVISIYLCLASFCFGKWFEKCYGCWHLFNDMEDWEDEKKRIFCGTWITLCGGLIIGYSIIFCIIFLPIYAGFYE